MNWKPIYVNEQINIDTLYSFFIENTDKNFDFGGETHNFWECRFIIEGNARISGDELVYDLSEGDIIFHKPMELHKLSINEESGATILIFSFNMSGPLTNYFKDKVFHLNNEQLNIIKAMLNFLNNNTKAQTNNQYMKEEQFLHHEKNNPLYIQRVVVYLYQLLLSLADNPNISDVSTASDAQIFKAAVEYMNNKIFYQPSVFEIAKHCCLSESGLKRLFNKYAGLSVHKYFLKLKFKVAYKLLSDGMSVCEVAEKLNFSSQSYFSASFKREVGINPSKITNQKF